MKTISWKAMMAMLCLLATLNFISCKEDDEDPDTTELLTDGNWKLTAMTSDPAIDWFGTPVTNVYAQLPACIKDDFTIFKDNGTVNFDEGASKCDPSDPQTTSGTWTLNTDETILSVTTDGETESWNIEELKEKTFSAKYEITDLGVNYTLSVTFTKQ